MPQTAGEETVEVIESLDVSHIETEDDVPVDNIASAKQQRLLVESLYSGWSPQALPRRHNVGLFSALNGPPVVPDMFLSLDVFAHHNSKRRLRIDVEALAHVLCSVRHAFRKCWRRCHPRILIGTTTPGGFDGARPSRGTRSRQSYLAA